jgi:hypothetical protein
MTSGRSLTFLATLVWASVAVTAAPRAFSRHRSIASASAADFPVTGCSDLGVHFDHSAPVLQSEQRTITKSEAPLLHVQADSDGGLYVEGWEKETFSLTLCKAAEAGPDAEAILSQIRLTFRDGVVRISSPTATGRWAARLLIRAPKDAALDLQVHNGPLTLTHVDGNLKVRAENGPVTVSSCTGELNLSSQNGPVTLDDNSGKQNVQARNGPISLSLSGNSWRGAGIEASTTNGPVSLTVPAGYQSGVILESEGHSPFQCSARVCSEGRKTWADDHQQIAFGSGPTVVHVSSSNGPVSVR